MSGILSRMDRRRRHCRPCHQRKMNQNRVNALKANARETGSTRKPKRPFLVRISR